MINPRRLLKTFYDLSEQSGRRHSLLDCIIFMEIIHSGGEASYANFCHFIDKPTSHGSFDKPVSALVKHGLIKRVLNEGVSTKMGQRKTTFRLTKKGKDLAKEMRCQNQKRN